jgi:hypothetical protein
MPDRFTSFSRDQNSPLEKGEAPQAPGLSVEAGKREEL